MFGSETVYIITTLLSAVAIFTVACGLIGIKIPRKPAYRNIILARNLLIGAYLILVVMTVFELLNMTGSDNRTLMLSATLITASFQAFFFTFSLITILNCAFLSPKRLRREVLPIVCCSVLLLVNLLWVDAYLQNVLHILIVCYGIQLIYYISLFRKELARYKEKALIISPDEQRLNLKWISVSFYSALSIGIMALMALFVNQTFYIVFVIIYTSFYIYFAIKYINYSIKPVKAHPEKESETRLKTISKEINVSDLNKWIDSKGYTQSGITLDILAAELCTNRYYLSNYINREKNLSFKVWISQLRIEEAKYLLKTQTELPLKRIGELVGIPDKASFYRQFTKITGTTPGEYRKNTIE